ncbi:Y-family DNA polymerase [Amycolatopsis sp. NPDC004079]|uniref:Y-family DNA polymerase n=1 Tax=Amycolatopsis sp. NPDC004079 TaxID=3154549 RepID=UPI0033A3F38B
MVDKRRSVVLADVDSMYVSAERIFNVGLNRRPVVVLSNNDGCVVARSKEAKALEIGMGEPWFKVRTRPSCRDVVALSSNYELYGDFSSRLATLCGQLAPRVEPYSIDECFLEFPAGEALDAAVCARERSARWLGLPVTVGIGRTKTLAKIATNHAKDSGIGVFSIDALSRAERAELLASIPVGEVWGIGGRLSARLAAHGVTTAKALADLDPGWVRRAYTIVVERTVRELQGVSCIPLTEQPAPRRSIMHCRHLGQPATKQDEVAAAASAFAQAVSAKLRRLDLAVPAVTVMLSTGGFGTGPPHHAQATQGFPVPLNAAGQLATTAARLARGAWRPGHRYKRVGVLASDLVQARRAQSLWPDDPRHDKLAAVLDTITARHGRDLAGYGRSGIRGPSGWDWRMRQEMRTPRFTTRWDELPVVS